MKTRIIKPNPFGHTLGKISRIYFQYKTAAKGCIGCSFNPHVL